MNGLYWLLTCLGCQGDMLVTEVICQGYQGYMLWLLWWYVEVTKVVCLGCYGDMLCGCDRYVVLTTPFWWWGGCILLLMLTDWLDVLERLLPWLTERVPDYLRFDCLLQCMWILTLQTLHLPVDLVPSAKGLSLCEITEMYTVRTQMSNGLW